MYTYIDIYIIIVIIIISLYTYIIYSRQYNIIEDVKPEPDASTLKIQTAGSLSPFDFTINLME